MNVLKIIAILALIAAVAVAAIYVMGMFDQTKPIADAATNLGNQAIGYVQGNIPAVTAAATGIVGVGTIALNKVQSAKKQASDIQSQATTKIGELQHQKDEILTLAKAEVTEATAKTTEIQHQLDDYKAEVEPLKTQVTSLQDQVQSAKDENAQFVMSLMSSANGALVTNPVDGKVYSVLKTPPEIHVK